MICEIFGVEFLSQLFRDSVRDYKNYFGTNMMLWESGSLLGFKSNWQNFNIFENILLVFYLFSAGLWFMAVKPNPIEFMKIS